jgi:hypothetical protein
MFAIKCIHVCNPGIGRVALLAVRLLTQAVRARLPLPRGVGVDVYEFTMVLFPTWSPRSQFRL